jgi:hypothetical protein
VDFGIDERAVVVNALAVALEVVQARKAALACAVGAQVRLGTLGVVRSHVRL